MSKCRIFSFRTGKEMIEPRFGNIQLIYGAIILEKWKHLFDVEEFLNCLKYESEDGETIHEEVFIRICNKFNLNSNATIGIYLSLKREGIFNFS